MMARGINGLFFRLAVTFVAATALACSSSPSPQVTDEVTGKDILEPGGDPVSVVDAETETAVDTMSTEELLEAFFSLDAVHTIRIEVDTDGIALLEAAPKVYVPGSVRIGEVQFDEVGIRLKGGFGSFIPLNGDEGQWGHGNGAPGKSGFIIDFNRYVKGQNFLGLKKLTLNNMVQDPSGLNQYLGYAVFREGGVPASRSGFGQVSFNDETKGLYALIETPDNDSFLEKWYGTDQGNLYEGAGGSDLVEEVVDAFDQDNGQDLSKQDLHEVSAILDAIGPDQDAWDVLSEVLDMDQYLTYAATELYLGHWDGYAWSRNNYIIHHDTVGGGWTFLPWGIDQLFEEDDMLGAFGGVMKSPGPSWEPPELGIDSMFRGGRVHQLCISSANCRARLADAFDAVILRVDQMDLKGLAEDARNLVEPLLVAEALEFGDPEVTKDALDGIFHFLDQRGQALAGWLPCLRGGAVDHDDDGHDGCTADCDDWSASIHPEAPESCNLMDDDCNAVVDDPAHCPKCVDVSDHLAGDYSLCFEPRTWQHARQYCQDRGQDLASFHDGDTAMYAGWYFLSLVGVTESWIGLNDIETEGTYQWTDGTPLDFENWIIEIPPEWTEHLDCVYHHALLGWLPHPCYKPKAFICGS